MRGRLRVERDDGSAAVVGVFAAVDEAVCLELGRQLARRRQRDAERLSDLAHRLRTFGADVGECRDVPPAELGLARDELRAAPATAAAAARAGAAIWRSVLRSSTSSARLTSGIAASDKQLSSSNSC